MITCFPSSAAVKAAMDPASPLPMIRISVSMGFNILNIGRDERSDYNKDINIHFILF
jgi:hypothetical protein